MALPSRPQSVTLEGKGTIRLSQGDYVTAGGEASIFKVGKTIIKVFTDQKKMAADRMPQKLQELKRMRHPYIVAPEGLVLNDKQKPIGFYMPYADGEPLSRIFTNSFRDREGFTDAHANALVAHMREAVQFAHGYGATLVDANELNWLVKLGKDPQPRVVDVDSWMIGSWQASVIMPSIRDWHGKGFTALSDWFSWGVVTFQIYAGIHPYRGTLTGFKNGDIEARMKANASVFHAGVDLSRAVRDFNAIPPALRTWYEEVFEGGSRSIPPSPFDTARAGAPAFARTHRMVVTGRSGLAHELLYRNAADPAVRIFPCGAVLLRSGKVVDLTQKGRRIGQLSSPSGEVVRVDSGWLFAELAGGKVSFRFTHERSFAEEEIDFSFAAHALLRYEDRLFLATEHALVELEFLYASKPILSVGRQTEILQPKAVKWFDGFGIMEGLGASFMVLPFGEHSSTVLRAKELDGKVAVAGLAGPRYAVVVALDRSGEYRKIEFTLSRDYGSYIVTESRTDTPEANVAILEKGVCATILKDGELTLFAPSAGRQSSIADREISTDMVLGRIGERVAYLRGGDVFTVRTL